MNKNLVWRIILIVAIIALSVWTLYPPQKTLKPGIDLAGGTSLIYEIDTHGLKPSETKDLSTRMINILRRRIDPVNIQNLVWRPQGNTRFEIQVPLASVEARQKRQNYENALNEILKKNINVAAIMRSLQKPAEERKKDFEVFARGAEDRLKILNDLATAYDERQALQKQRDELKEKLKTPESLITMAGLDLDVIKSKVGNWATLNEENRKKAIIEYLNKSEGNLDLLTRYTALYADWAKVAEQLTNPETGKNAAYEKARKGLDSLNLNEDQLEFCLELSADSGEKHSKVAELEKAFPDRKDAIEKLVTAANEYRQFRGRLDDPKDLQRMLKGSGVLEFRILPTYDSQKVSSDVLNSYVEAIKAKGPKLASDDKYIWCQVETAEEAKKLASGTRAAVAQFGNKYYVLASNLPDEVMLHNMGWKLDEARPDQDSEGRRAIGFALDERGGNLFSALTGKNMERPLCILLDGIALSAPNIRARISTRGIITGSYSQVEQADMIDKLNAGSLPASLVEQPVSVRTIGPSIGADNRDKGIIAGIVGLAGVVVFMAIYYTVGGLIADVALLLNVLILLAVMAFARATFTLAGIAGLVLTIGMSVDANILIFERIREEQQKGCSLRVAIKNGYERAFSVIFDSNLTTVLSALILYWIASEDIKSFAIVLIIGLSASMFTALFVTRTIFEILLAKKWLKNQLVMLHIIRSPNIDWMKARWVLLVISGSLVVGGLVVFFTRNDVKNNKYDIEFTGGTAAQISLKKPMSRQEVENKIQAIGNELGDSALAAASVYRIGETDKQYEINTTETNKTNTLLTFPQSESKNLAVILSEIKKAAEELDKELPKLAVTPKDDKGTSFLVSTSQLNGSVVKDVLGAAFKNAQVSEPQIDHVVDNAIMKAFKDQMEIQLNLHPEIISVEKISGSLVDSYPELADFLGGVKITCNLQTPTTTDDLSSRFKDLRFKPDIKNIEWYSYQIRDSKLNALELNQPIQSFVYLSVQPEAGFREVGEEEWARFLEGEKSKVLTAAEMEGSLQQVTQIDPSVGSEAKTRALIAIILSFIAMMVYLWVRFGNARYGSGAIIALIHDVCITLGAVTACAYIAGSPLADKLLIGDFKINLPVVAAFLTLVGYSVNDTIVVFDRIRENAHKGTVTPQLINDSINQTLSRTILTSFTTFLVVLIIYIFGGTTLRAFNFVMVFGIIVGTYSSIAIASPMLILRSKAMTDNK